MILGTADRYRIQWMLLVVALLALGALIAFSLYSEHNRIDVQERDRLQTQARVIDENLGRQMEGLNQAMLGVRDEVLPRSGKSTGPEAPRRLKALADSIPGLRTIGILDANGMTLTSSRDELIGRDFSEREFFKIVRARPDAGTLYVSAPFHTALGAFSINLTRAVVGSKGEFAGVVTITLAPEYFSVLLNSVLYAPDMRASIVHGDGKLVLEEPHRKNLNGLDLARPGSRYTQHVQSGQAASVFANGTALGAGDQRMTAWRTIRRASLRTDKPLMVSVDRDMARIFASWRRDVYVHGGLFGVVLVISILGLFLLQRRQTEQDRLEAAYEAERTRAEDALRESEARFHSLTDLSSDWYWEQDRELRLILHSSGFAEHSGTTSDKLLGKRRWEEHNRFPLSCTWDEHRATLEAHKPFRDFEYVRIGDDGTQTFVSLSGEPIFDAAGNFNGYRGVGKNITERKRAEALLNESQGRFSAVFHASPIGITVSRVADGKILEVNDAALRMYCYARDEMIGHTVAELGTYAIPAQREALVQRLREHGSVDRFPIDLRRSSGELGVLELSGRVIELQGEQCLVAMMLDVTERKRLEHAHLQAQKLESLGTLAGGIAHDFNNILAAIRGNADLAAADVGPDHIAAESLQEIRKASARASELVRRIMAFGRPREAQQEVVDLNAVAAEVLKLLRSTLPAGISLSKQFAKDAPHVLADAGQIHEAIVNLTTNAAYAIGPRAGSIEYRLEPVHVDAKLAQSIPGIKQGRYARLTVTDSGCGMDAATLERIFDAFYTTKPVGEGTGLGLSMVHGIVRSHGGAVTVESARGKGSSFALYFPAAKEQAVKEEASAATRSLPYAGQRVLYVDDEEALVLLARRMFSRLGLQISGCTDPKEALEAFRARPHDYDMVVTDLSMPHMSGLEFARAVLAARPEIPVLMTTGHVRAEDEVRARAAGIRALMLKPVTLDELHRVFEQIMPPPPR